MRFAASLLALLVACHVVTPRPVVADEQGAAGQSALIVVIDADVLEDKIRGGLLAQVIGNLNGLPHEFKYIDAPGDVRDYTPALPDGAVTDDDTDVEWVYVTAIARSGQSKLTPQQIANLWRRHINRRIFASNLYARKLMGVGIGPPWTGNAGLNPWSQFNISGQFLCESFGLMAPAMPQTASRLGCHYTSVAIDGEPAQATELFATMISMAFVESDVDRLLDAGIAAVDPASRMVEVVRETRKICTVHPNDWRAARAEIKRRWQVHHGETRDRNGYELNGACTVAALIYGKSDLKETLRIAFNLGWDCDNNAATAATIVGVIKGRRWIDEQGWEIADVYRNTTRDQMPMDETLTSFGDRLIACAKIVVEEQGGEVTATDGERVYRIHAESPRNVIRLASPETQINQLRQRFVPRLETDLAAEGHARARAAYIAICLGETDRLKRERPDEWAAAIKDLQNARGLMRVLALAPEPEGDNFRKRATQAGLSLPADTKAK